MIPERQHLTTAIRVGAVVLFPATLVACLIAFLAWLLCVAPAWLAYGIRIGRKRVGELTRAIDGVEPAESGENKPRGIVSDTVVYRRKDGESGLSETAPGNYRYQSEAHFENQAGFFAEQMRVKGWKKAKLVMRLEEIPEETE